ncbi:hypothetical protein MTYM_00475 [Methylococcales bacterium]|nr:hypothetical protein MTYM_00475 [Methylococcales bacterium]
MHRDKALATDAMKKALLLRKRLEVPLDESVSAIDAAERLGIEVRLADFPSMEGMYIAGNSPKIILTAMRPQGRRNFTCAHELGHHNFNHGEQFDDILEANKLQRKDLKEFAADCFAAYFLMPKATIESGISRRGFALKSLDAIQAYALASWLGVGYKTLVSHLLHGTGMISHHKADELYKLQPRDIRQQLLGETVSSQLHLIDNNWIGRAIDCEVGDYLLFDMDAIVEGEHLIKMRKKGFGTILQAVKPGISRVSNASESWGAFVRISSPGFVGRSCYRFEDEVLD